MRYSAQQIRPFRDSKGKQWTHPSVSELMKLAKHADECPVAVIQRLCHELVIEARSHGWTGPPYDPSLLASLEDIRVEKAPSEMEADARIFPTTDGKLLIQYSTSSSKERQRFSIAHEIGHTRFPDCYERVRYRGSSSERDFVHAELEHLCNLAASEILMPADDMKLQLGTQPLSVELTERLRGVFDANEPCAVIFMSLRLKPTEERETSGLFPGFQVLRRSFEWTTAVPVTLFLFISLNINLRQAILLSTVQSGITFHLKSRIGEFVTSENGKYKR
jgi:hypothetical protein